MRTRDINKILKLIGEKLSSYYEKRLFSLAWEGGESKFHNGSIVIPFYDETSRGSYFTIKPCFVIQIDSLKTAINEIISDPIWTNGIFLANTQLANYFGNHEFDNVVENNFKWVYANFWYKIYGIDDVDWVVERHKLYMEKVGWKFVANFTSDKTMYEFYREMFIKWVSDDPRLNILERSLNLPRDAHITMIYIGLRDGHNDIDKLIELTFNNRLGSIIHDATKELIQHFSNQ